MPHTRSRERAAARLIRALCALVALLAACSRGGCGEKAPASRVPSKSAMKESWDWNGVIGTGQSLAVGVEGRPLRATTASFRNLKLDLGSRWFPALDAESSRISLVPLAEPIRPLAWRYPGPYPRNIFGETPHTGMASQITAAFLKASGGEGDYVTVHSVVGESGQALDVISKHASRSEATGHAYEASLFEARAITRLAKLAGRSFGIAAVVLTHGESDAQNGNYAQGVLELWRDYNADIAAITGQTRGFPLLATQQSSGPLEPGSVAVSALQLLKACEEHPEDVVCVGPRYQYGYAADGVHLDAQGYDRLGEKYGQAYFQQLVLGHAWRALRPREVTREGDVIRVAFYVPVPPLAWDDSLPAPARDLPVAWAAGRGFELSSSAGPVEIRGVELKSDSVRIHHSAPAGTALMLRYAATASALPRPGGTRRWGQLCDSDTSMGAVTKTRQRNYALSFEVKLP